MFNKIKHFFPGGKSGPVSNVVRQGSTFNKKAVVVGALLIISVLAMVAMFSFESSQARKNKLYITIASEQQVISQQITVNALEAAVGQQRAFDRLGENQNRYLSTLDKFNNGDLTQAIPPLPEDFSVEFSNLKSVWSDYDKHIATVVAAKSSIATVSDYVTQINESLPELISLSDRVVDELVKSGAPRRNIAVAARQVILVRSIEHIVSTRY